MGATVRMRSPKHFDQLELWLTLFSSPFTSVSFVVADVFFSFPKPMLSFLASEEESCCPADLRMRSDRIDVSMDGRVNA